MTNQSADEGFTVVIPCFNEEGAIAETLAHLASTLPDAPEHEIIVVDDGSTDGTPAILEDLARQDKSFRVVVHQRNRGYGAALKTGIRNARFGLIVITDADGTYPNDRIPDLLAACKDHDMAVGSRTGASVTYSKIRKIPKVFLTRWASWIARQSIPDINSGLRVFKKSAAEKFLGILPDSFSFTMTITLALLTNYRPVAFVPIDYHARVGQSKIKPIRDTLRFIMIILRTGVYFAPLRIFMPFVGILFALAIGSLSYDAIVLENLTDKTVILFLFAFNTGMFALLADMIDKRSP
ncbi:MAG: glycosyltransferase family 2 protein [Alphaproteobacteria bacterium]